MKKAFILLGILFLFFPKITFAHLVGQPPFLKINGKYANLYPVPLTSLNNFNLPQDAASENYLVNTIVSFELDQKNLPAPPDVIAKTKFTWDFGDGATLEGLVQKHSYSKIGSVILDVYADDRTTPKPQIIEKVMLNILPNHDYQLPQAVISVNGQMGKDPLTDILQFKFGEELNLDARNSKSSGKIVSFLWDLGDQSFSDKAQTPHTYAKDLTQVFPVLRIKDDNGFISDSFVELQNQSLTQTTALTDLKKAAVVNKKSDSPSQLKTSLGILALILGGFGVYFYLRNKHDKHH